MSSWRILIAHCRYQRPGGEDRVVAAEAQLLERHGHTVRLYERDNNDITGMSTLSLAAQTVWSARTGRDVRHLCKELRPHIVHVHNTFPLISPAIYWTAYRMRIPLVQTLHNFRLLCPQALLLREGKICEDCVGKLPWRAVAHKCYRDSAAASGAIAFMLETHRILGSFRDKVTRYIATNQFYADKFALGGIPAKKISLKQHFVDLPPPNRVARSGGLYVGRLSPEKGIGTLIDALHRLPSATFTVIGDGTERSRITPRVHFLGWKEPEVIYESMRSAAYLVIPSIWYETGPLTLIEAFACGLPVIASRLGALAESVTEGETGLLFEPGSAKDLGEKIAWAESHPEDMLRMGENARTEYELRYTPEANYQRLMEIYAEAIGANNCAKAA
jgi:glycosyltransferase involved in cell wall biosynthesis